MADSTQTSGKTEGLQGVRCLIVTPESTILDARAQFVRLPLFDGQRGVGRGHAPFIGRLGSGEVRLVGGPGIPADAVRSVFVEGGFVEVGQDAVTVITQRAVVADKLDAEKVRAELEKLRAVRATGDEAIAERMKAEESVRAQLRAAGQVRP
jgi:F-type H+-transporting ATPase subunit epsilon